MVYFDNEIEGQKRCFIAVISNNKHISNYLAAKCGYLNHSFSDVSLSLISFPYYFWDAN